MKVFALTVLALVCALGANHVVGKEMWTCHLSFWGTSLALPFLLIFFYFVAFETSYYKFVTYCFVVSNTACQLARQSVEAEL